MTFSGITGLSSGRNAASIFAAAIDDRRLMQLSTKEREVCVCMCVREFVCVGMFVFVCKSVCVCVCVSVCLCFSVLSVCFSVCACTCVLACLCACV